MGMHISKCDPVFLRINFNKISQAKDEYTFQSAKHARLCEMGIHSNHRRVIFGSIYVDPKAREVHINIWLFNKFNTD